MTTFDDLKVQEYEFDIVGPDDQTLRVTMRAPTPEQVLEVSRANPKPQPPVSDIRRDGDRFFNVYNYEDGTYQATLQAWITNTRRMMIARTVVSPEIPGDTLPEKAEALKDVAAWALVGLHRAADMLTGGADDSVTMRKFQQERVDS